MVILAAAVAIVGGALAGAAPATATSTSGVQVITQPSPSNALDKSATAKCPGGTRVTGGGGEIIGSNRAVLTELRPFSTAAGDGYSL